MGAPSPLGGGLGGREVGPVGACARALRALNDPAEHRGRSSVVLGGGDSAVEAALALASEPGTSVALVHRGARFDRVKPDNRARLEAAEAQGALPFALIGTDLPTELLSRSGIAVKTWRGESVA